ncbi:MAG TPA: glycosyltransferase family 87 protein [Anaerolineaceae bacterium]|nr:glycosyltransferase family 87 protein [Anaerolineaceae bacterium]
MIIVHLVDNLYPMIGAEPARPFAYPAILDFIQPAGNDFRIGLYNPAKALLAGIPIYGADGNLSQVITIYPPLVNVLAIPFTLFSDRTAYLIQIALLYIANITCLALSAWMAIRVIISRDPENRFLWAGVAASVFIGIVFFTVNSYGFDFSIERGNYDILALIFGVLSMYWLVRHPEQIWIQVILLSIGVHLKIYPVILFAVLFFRHRFKLVIPALVVNLGYLFILGPSNGIAFIRAITYFGDGRMGIWVGNHSAGSFAILITNHIASLAPYQNILKWILLLLPFALWISGVGFVWFNQKKFQESYPIWGLALSIPMMDLLPTISHDYKLVIESTSMVILVILVIEMIFKRNRWQDYLQLVVLIGILLLIGRSYALIDQAQFYLQNKYFAVLAIQALVLYNLIQSVLTTNLPRKAPVFIRNRVSIEKLEQN